MDQNKTAITNNPSPSSNTSPINTTSNTSLPSSPTNTTSISSDKKKGNALTITIVVAIIVIVIIICIITVGLYYYYEIYRKNITPLTPINPVSPTGPTGGTCSNSGFNQIGNEPNYIRNNSYFIDFDTNAEFLPLSINTAGLFPTYSPTGNAVIPLSRMRTYTEKSIPISTNHFASNSFYGPGNQVIDCYPYYLSVLDQGLTVGFPSSLSTATGPTGAAGPFPNYDVESSYPIDYQISSYINCNSVISCDVVDIDCLSTTIIWHYNNGALIEVPLVKSSPYITYVINGSRFSLSSTKITNGGCPADSNPNYKWQITNISSGSLPNDPLGDLFQINIAKLTDPFIPNKGYIISFSQKITYTKIIKNGFTCGLFLQNNFQGYCRLAWFEDNTIKTFLINNRKGYPKNASMSAAITDYNFNLTSATKTFQLQTVATLQIIDGTNTPILYTPDSDGLQGVISYPNNFYNNVDVASFNSFANTNTNLVLNDFIYPTNLYDTSGSTKWTAELNSLIALNVNTDFNSYTLWLLDIATMLLIGKAYGFVPNNNADAKKALDFLKLNLDKFKTGNLTSQNIIYDISWKGLISSLGLNDCSTLSNDGLSFYNNHSGQFGNIVYVFSVVGYFDLDYIKTNPEICLFFIRDYCNPSIKDRYFPLVRDFDFFFGFNWQTGLSPNQIRGKTLLNVGTSIFGYYSAYLYSLILGQIPSYLNIAKSLQLISLSLLSVYSKSFNGIFQMGLFNQSPGFLPPSLYANNLAQNQTYLISKRQATTFSYSTDPITDNFPERFASIIKPLFLPLSIASKLFILNSWANNTITQSRMASAVASADISEEDLAYAYAIQAIPLTTPASNAVLAAKVKLLFGTILPPGTTISMLYYWVVLQAS